MIAGPGRMVIAVERRRCGGGFIQELRVRQRRQSGLFPSENPATGL